MGRKMVVILLGIILVAAGVWYVGFSATDLQPQQTSDANARVGKASSSFTLDSLDGTKVTVGQPGRTTVINFWATWCPPCLEEMPELEEFAKKINKK